MAVRIATTLEGPEELDNAFQRKLLKSALDLTHARKLGLVPLLAEDVARKHPELPVYKAGFRIPYFTLDGMQTKFWRFRYLETTKKGFAKQTQGKELRYTQPKNTTNELYLPPLINWKRVADDVSKPIVFTEGELKSACACAQGLPTIGLGGVWCFKSTKHHIPLLEQFGEFKWQGRIVYICYDSDAQWNQMVLQAENALAKELTKLGAMPHIVRLPSLCPPHKTGLDDYIASEGIEPLQYIFDNAIEWKSAQELLALNEEVVYVKDPGLVLKLDTLQRITPRAFTDHAYSTRIYFEETVTEKGSKLVEKSAPKEWLRWPSRSTVERTTYAPGEERITGKGELNVWPGYACEPVEGNIEPWLELLNHLFNGNAKEIHWFQQWLAYPLKYPGTKLFTAVVMHGRIHGTGKSLIGYTMFRIYGQNSVEITDKELASPFNEWAENKQFVMGDEIAGGDKRHAADRMKSMITQKQLRLNQKYLPSYVVPDCINYYFTSNHPDAFFLEDTDRRFYIWEVTNAVAPSAFYERYVKWMNGSGPHALFHHLLTYDLEGFNPGGHAPLTESKEEMIESGRSDVGAWVARLKTDPDSVLRMDKAICTYKLMTTEELHVYYDPEKRTRVSAPGMGRELRRAGVLRAYDGRPVPTHKGSQRLWIVRDHHTMVAYGPKQLAKQFAEERGVK